ncbi:MAG: transposase [Prevotellaceae bacterium]|nr:transposase [Prevotellaceae bacterium]
MTNYSAKLTGSQCAAMIQVIGGARKRKHLLREILNAVFYLLKTGCRRRMLPCSFPEQQPAY